MLKSGRDLTLTDWIRSAIASACWLLFTTTESLRLEESPRSQIRTHGWTWIWTNLLDVGVNSDVPNITNCWNGLEYGTNLQLQYT